MILLLTLLFGISCFMLGVVVGVRWAESRKEGQG